MEFEMCKGYKKSIKARSKGHTISVENGNASFPGSSVSFPVVMTNGKPLGNGKWKIKRVNDGIHEATVEQNEIQVIISTMKFSIPCTTEVSPGDKPGFIKIRLQNGKIIELEAPWCPNTNRPRHCCEQHFHGRVKYPHGRRFAQDGLARIASVPRRGIVKNRRCKLAKNARMIKTKMERIVLSDVEDVSDDNDASDDNNASDDHNASDK